MLSLATRAEYLEAQACAELLLALPAKLRSALGVQVIRDGDAVSLLTAAADIGSFNRSIGFGLAGNLTDDELRAIHAPYVRAGIRRWLIEWCPEARPAIAGASFGRLGGQVRTPTVKFWCPLDDHAPIAVETDLHIVEIGAPEAETFKSIVAPAFGLPDVAAPIVCSTVGHDGWHLYLALDAGRPIAGALMFVRGEGAWLGLGATVPAERRRGAQTALLAHRLREAIRLNCRWATAEAMLDTEEHPNPSYRNMHRAGMRALYHRAKYVFELDSSPAFTCRPKPSA